jgi:hypothetical protein
MMTAVKKYREEAINVFFWYFYEDNKAYWVRLTGEEEVEVACNVYGKKVVKLSARCFKR